MSYPISANGMFVWSEFSSQELNTWLEDLDRTSPSSNLAAQVGLQNYLADCLATVERTLLLLEDDLKHAEAVREVKLRNAKETADSKLAQAYQAATHAVTEAYKKEHGKLPSATTVDVEAKANPIYLAVLQQIQEDRLKSIENVRPPVREQLEKKAALLGTQSKLKTMIFGLSTRKEALISLARNN